MNEKCIKVYNFLKENGINNKYIYPVPSNGRCGYYSLFLFNIFRNNILTIQSINLKDDLKDDLINYKDPNGTFDPKLYVNNYCSELKNFFPDITDFIKLFTKQPGKWMDHPEIIRFRNIFKKNIILINYDDNVGYIKFGGNTENETLDRRDFFEKFKNSDDTLFLLYHNKGINSSHYELIDHIKYKKTYDKLFPTEEENIITDINQFTLIVKTHHIFNNIISPCYKIIK